MKYRLSTLLITVAAITASSLFSDDPPAQRLSHPVTPIMQLKLEKSKAILEGLTLEDFDAIEKNARSLKLLSMESGWKVLQTEEYAMQSADFRRTADLVADAADEEDIQPRDTRVCGDDGSLRRVSLLHAKASHRTKLTKRTFLSWLGLLAAVIHSKTAAGSLRHEQIAKDCEYRPFRLEVSLAS